jgi:multidrug efflux pump subunit AcrA (membrane-fusion protein)
VQERTSDIGKAQGEMLIEDAKYSEEAARNKARQAIANARFNEEQARRMLELSQLQLQWCAVKAPISGLAVVRREYDESLGSDRPLRAGDQVYPMKRLMDIIDTSRMIVEAQIGEIDIGHVRTGQTARVYPRAAPGTMLRGVVKSVSEVASAPPVWRSSRMPGKKVFNVILSVLDSRPKLLRPGMTVDFELVEDTVKGGVRVPIQAVFHDQVSRSSGVQVFRTGKDKGESGHAASKHLNTRTPEHLNAGIVYVRKDGRFWPRTVALGKRNDNDVLVTQGLKPGDVLAEELPPATLIGPAVRKEQRAHGGLLSFLNGSSPVRAASAKDESSPR